MAKKETSLQLHKIVNFRTVVSEAHSLWVALYLEGEGGVNGRWVYKFHDVLTLLLNSFVHFQTGCL